jgi:hypothetical protein
MTQIFKRGFSLICFKLQIKSAKICAACIPRYPRTNVVVYFLIVTKE